MRRLSATSIMLLVTAGLFGCGAPKDTTPRVGAKGKLVDGGKPWVYDDSKVKSPKGVSAPPAAGSNVGPVQMAFISADGTAGVEYAQLDTKTGLFEVKNLKPGRYKIAIYSTLSSAGATPTPPGANPPPDPTDPFGGKFSQGNTKIIKDIQGGEEIVIDVSKPKG